MKRMRTMTLAALRFICFASSIFAAQAANRAETEMRILRRKAFLIAHASFLSWRTCATHLKNGRDVEMCFRRLATRLVTCATCNISSTADLQASKWPTSSRSMEEPFPVQRFRLPSRECGPNMHMQPSPHDALCTPLQAPGFQYDKFPSRNDCSSTKALPVQIDTCF